MTSKAFNPFGDSNFTNLLGDLKIPGVDLAAIVDSQRKNIDALTAANRAAIERMEAFAKRQSEILTETMQKAAAAVQQLATVGTPQEMVAKQTELAAHAFEKALANMREVAETIHVGCLVNRWEVDLARP